MLLKIIFPVNVYSELILGKRTPKVFLIEKNSTKTLEEKTIIPCPYCGTMHSGLKWTPQNKTAFGNWFGLYCDNCGRIIPCISNLLSYILLGLKFPFWYWFRGKRREKWLVEQQNKFSKSLILTKPVYKWWHIGLDQAIFMCFFMEFLFPLITHEVIIKEKLLIGIPIWLGAGMFSGWWRTKGGKKKAETQIE